MSTPTGVILTRGATPQVHSYDQFSSTLLDFFDTSFQNRAATWDGTDLINTLMFGSQSIVSKRIGFSGTVKENLNITATDSDVWGATWDGDNLLTTGHGNDDYYLHDGYSTTVSDTVTGVAIQPVDMSWHRPTSDMVVPHSSGVIYFFDGFSSTVLDSINPVGFSIGVDSDGKDYIDFPNIPTLVQKLDGFSTTVIDEFVPSGAGGGLFGGGWGLRYSEGTRRERASKAHHRSTMRRRH